MKESKKTKPNKIHFTPYFKPPKSISEFFSIYIKGIAMGAADIVPGISGGTIALISGIYTRLISAISRADIKLVKIWKQGGLVQGFKDVWQYMDATFLVCLAVGIITSFITLAGIISSLLDTQPLFIWSLFFGLILATVYILFKEIKQWNWQRALLFVIGIILAVTISMAPLVSGEASLPYLFFAGSIAICAMILPGISGSFILVLLGVYDTVLNAVHNLQIDILATMIAGIVFGLLAFSKFLKWLLINFYQSTLALLTGFIAGSLFKIYPWQLDGQHLLPNNYTGGAHWVTCLSLMVVGAGIVFIISSIGKTPQEIQ